MLTSVDGAPARGRGEVDAIEASTFEIERECARVMHEVRSHTPDLPEKVRRGRGDIRVTSGKGRGDDEGGW